MILEYIVLLDWASIFIMILLIASIFIKRLYTLRSSKLFIALIILSIATATFDILSVRFFDEPFLVEEIYKTMGFTFNNIYYILRTSTIIIYTIYILELTDSFKYFIKRPLILFLSSIPILICYGIEISNIFTNSLFSVELNEYGRYYFTTNSMPLSMLLYVIPSLYFTISIIVAIRFRYYFTKSQIASILSIIPLTLISFIFQYLSKTTNLFGNSIILFELFATTLGLVLLTSTIESASELIDANTGLISFNRFNRVITKAINTKSKKELLLVEINNYSKIHTKLNYIEADKYINALSSSIKKLSKQIEAEAYSIDDGLYSFVVDFDVFDKKMIDDILNTLNNVFRKEYKPNVRVCVISMPTDFNDTDSLIKFIRNFHTKFKFKTEVIYYNELKNDRSFIIRNNIDKILEEAFIQNEFEVYYQPIYDIRDKSFNSCEALIRLNSKNYGFIEPKYFINYAELSGKILDIDLFVIEEVIKFIASDKFSELGIKFINVNISLSDCFDLTLYNRVLELIVKYGINPKCIHFELVEGNDLVNHDQVNYVLNKFQDEGIEISLDNYGVGYSNIENFTKAPIKTVKLDKKMVDESKDQNMNYVLSSTIELIKSLGRKIVIEGVETKETMDTILKYDLDYIQGYYYSKPITKDELIEFINLNREVK